MPILTKCLFLEQTTPMISFFLRFLAILGAGVICSGCSPLADNVSTELINNNFNSTLWVQQSSNFQATSLQTYNTAARNLKKAVNSSTVTAVPERTTPLTTLPPAVVLDIDETVLDNSSYIAQLILEDAKYSPQTWDQWIALQQATAIPGAVSFINHATDVGVEVIYITNRECKKRAGLNDICPQKTDTLKNLEKVGIKGLKPTNLLFKNEQQGWSSEKESRRNFVAQKYRIVMLFGDDFGDFLPNVKKNITSEQRAKLVTAHGEKWGHVWYILPNPNYGSWWNVLKAPKSQCLEGY